MYRWRQQCSKILSAVGLTKTQVVIDCIWCLSTRRHVEWPSTPYCAASTRSNSLHSGHNLSVDYLSCIPRHSSVETMTAASHYQCEMSVMYTNISCLIGGTEQLALMLRAIQARTLQCTKLAYLEQGWSVPAVQECCGCCILDRYCPTTEIQQQQTSP
jgi:hypothetical protein